MKESGTTMILHSAVIGLFAYVVMRYGVNQAHRVAEDRSVVLFAVVLLYMVFFGHGMPNKVNKNLLG